MSMSPQARHLTIGWGVLIAFAAVVVSLLGGFGGGMRAVGQFDQRVRGLELCSDRHEREIEAGKDQRAIIAQDFGAKVATLNTDVKYIVKSVDEIKADMRQR